MTSPPIISLRDVVKDYETAAGVTRALAGVSLEVPAGELVGVVGRSGWGKSTLLNVLTGIDRPTEGQVLVAGAALHQLPEDRLAAWRGRQVGVVFQFFQLLPTLTVVENVMLPMDFCRTCPPPERRGRALALLERVGIAEQADKLPLALSGGQQQRAAIARALANDPGLIVADEPTGNLDSTTGRAIWSLFAALAAAGKTIIVVTHDPEVAGIASRVVSLADGTIVSDRRRSGATAASHV
jgi:putative ABC transport system ATP-binding protein